MARKKLNLINLLIVGLLFSSCNFISEEIFGDETEIIISNEHIPKDMVKLSEIQYDLSCMTGDDDDNVMGLINLLSGGHDGLISILTQEVTPEQEMEFGWSAYEAIKTEFNVKDNSTLTTILKKLVQQLPNSKYDYQIYEVEDKTINAFTIGAQIFVFTGMIDFCKSESELVAVVAHEVCHNELGHINKKLRPLVTLTSYFGEEVAGIATAIEGILTTPFGQKDEMMADLMGVDLTFHSNFDGCDAINVWERMALEEEYNEMEEIIRSHPFSGKRAECIRHHIQTNYEVDCD